MLGDAVILVVFRRLLGEEGVDKMLAQSINLAVSLKLIPASALATVMVDSIGQEKAVANPLNPSRWRWRAPSWCTPNGEPT
jgi:IS5 family transposase